MLINVRLRSGRTVPEVEAEVCKACGQRYYDLTAVEKLAAARKHRR